MRLTLRNILAYIDDILDPEDAEEIGKKIEESEFATALVHRVRDVMRRLRLGTPDVLGRGLGLDPNTVAEYLDHCLAEDPVLDFEKICLESGTESDVHLAEVASCHQILALVLGEPAEVDPASRERMYQLPKRAESEAEPAVKSGDSRPAKPGLKGQPDLAESATLPAPTGPSVPEWLREERSGRRGWWPTIAAVSLALAFGVFLLAVTGQLSPGSFLGDLLGPKPADPSVVAGPEPAAGWTPEETPGEQAGEPPAPSAPDGQTATADLPVPDERATTPRAGAGEGPGPGMEAPSPGAPSELAMPREPLPADVPPAALGPSEPLAAPAADQAAGVPTEPGTEAALPTSAPPATPLAQPPIPEVNAVATDQQGPSGAGAGVEPRQTPQPRPATTAAPVPPQVVGQFDSPGQVLLVFDEKARAWGRLRDKASLMSQTSYLSLPTYRPMIRLADQTRIWLVDGTEIELLAADQEGVAGLEVSYGGLILQGPEEASSRLRLRVDGQSGVITFDQAGSRLGIEVVRDAGWNADPETQPAPLSVGLYVASGKVLWQGATDREPAAVEAPLGVTLKDRPFEKVAPDQFPTWIVTDTIKKLDEMASEAVEREWEPDKPPMVRLRELANHRKKEYRSLALDCLDYLGDFELLVAALDNPDEQRYWVDYVEQLRVAVVRSPQTAERVRAAMEKLHGREGATLYEMLWKYNDNVLDGEDAARLVRCLDHNTLAFRVVSFETLKRITRLNFAYRPEEEKEKRQPAIKKWADRLLATPRGQAGAPGRTPAPAAAEDPSSAEPLPDVPNGFGL